jgi:hypothetical protein
MNPSIKTPPGSKTNETKIISNLYGTDQKYGKVPSGEHK